MLTYAIPRASSRIVAADGTVSRDWYLFLSALLQTVGGPAVTTGGGSEPLDGVKQFEEYAATSLEAAEALRAVDELRNELASTRSDMQSLRRLIDELSAALATPPQNDQLRSRVQSLEDRLA